MVRQASNSAKLAISSSGIIDLLLSSNNLDFVNKWLNKNSEFLNIFLEELDTQLGSINNLQANIEIVNLVSRTKFLEFSDGNLYSLSEIKDKPTHIIIDEYYRDISNFLIKCGFLVLFIESKKHKHLYEFFSDYHKHLKSRNSFITFFSKGLESREILITQDELFTLLKFLNELSVSPFESLKIIKKR